MVKKVLRINILAQNITALCLGKLPSLNSDPYMNLHYHEMMGL